MREIINFNKEWLYCPEDNENGVFEKVSVPHANKILTEHKGGEKSFQEQIDSYRFVSWYKKHFCLPSEYENKRIFLEFEAVATVAEVYVNGNFAGCHKGAYTGFKLDITDYVSLGEDNLVSVRVDSTKRCDVPPEGGNVDYCLFGGIVRNVYLVVTSLVYIEDVTLITEIISDEKAIIKTEAVINGNGDYCVEVKDCEGNVVALGKELTEILNPHLWSIDEPYLYEVCVKTDCDTYTVKTGIRRVEFLNDGVLLNGKLIKIMGVNRHEQWPWIGRAVPDKLQARDADLIKETGFNAVRCSHYPQSPAFLNRCDEIGLLVFEEAPGWQHIGDEAWQEVYKENIREMITRDKNHPSVISWGVRVNESDDSDRLYGETNRLAHSLDPARPTHGARREDTYKASTYLEDIYTAHYVYPENPVHTPFLVTEHSWDCWGNGYGCPWASDEEALAFAKDFADKVNYYYGNPNCAGGFAWSMFDYNNEVNYTRTNNVFYSGLYDIFRLPKIAAHLYISQKDPKKYGANIYIANYWDDAAKPLTVKEISGDIARGNASGGGVIEGDAFSVTVMSNCQRVELYVNGVKVLKEPVRHYNNLPHPFFVYENIDFEPGEVTAVGYIDGNKVAEYTQKTPGKAVRLMLQPDYEGLLADGADMTQVSVVLTDENGTRLPKADNEVSLSIKGAGDFIGEEKIKLEGGRTAFIVKSRYNETGDIVCTASAEGIESGSCVIKVVKECE